MGDEIYNLPEGHELRSFRFLSEKIYKKTSVNSVPRIRPENQVEWVVK
jgi:hypothetical protein